MGKEKDSTHIKKVVDYNKNIIYENLSDLATENMKIFGANNNLMRHLPFLVDGLKPGERRILYAMFEELHATYDKRYKKVASIVGQTILYHPHGETPIYETTVKLAQSWNNIQCAIDGFGNFGSPLGDNAAAARYIEARLSFYSHKCFFEEFNTDIVDMKRNYTGDKYEPEYLPSRYPNVLINNSFGIGYGIMCGIPTYNLKEVIELTLKLMDDPEYENITLIPDSPTGAYIVDEGQFPELSRTGEGQFKMRGVMEVDEENNIISIKSNPLQTNFNTIRLDIIELFREGKLTGLKEFRDDTKEKKGINFKIHLKKEIDPYSIMHAIYSKTSMEKTFPVKFILIDDYEDDEYNIRSILLGWIDFRRETKRRVYNHKLIKYRERQHILTTLISITDGDNAEHTTTIVKKSLNKKEAAEKLMKAYSISSLQAISIANMHLYELTIEANKKYREEMRVITKLVEETEKIVRSSKKIDKKIKEELEEGIELFGRDRLSKIISIDGEVKIRNTNHIVVFTMNGLVKKLSDQCKEIGFVNQGDYPIEIIEIKNTSDLLIFDHSGKISKLPIHILMNSELKSEGEKLNKYCKIAGGITSILPKPTETSLSKIKAPIYFLMITKNGVIKKTLANYYTNIKNELLGLVIKDGDELKSVKLLIGDKDVIIYTNKGHGVRISTSIIKETSRMSIGIKSLNLTADEEVIGMDIVNEKDKYLFVLTNKGTGKKCTLDNFKTMDRNSDPLKITALDSGEEVMIIKSIKGDETFKAYLKNSIQLINSNEVNELPRLSKGKKLIPVPKGETIIDIKEVK